LLERPDLRIRPGRFDQPDRMETDTI